ncbi:MAG: insulinase family protein [Candidatus Eisenbacteria bacterium]|nr:insulinase family protein [Candidatus Eisenbacteria bacterium]
MRRVLVAVVCSLAVLALLAPVAVAQTLEEKVTEFELDNGMKFIIVERHEAPVVFCAVGFKVGAIYERPGITGISHLLEHMLFKGTETIGTKDYEAEKVFLDREDALAEQIRELMLEIEAWRLDYLEQYAKDLTASFSDEDRAAIGSDRALELDLLVEKMEEAGPGPELQALTGLLESEGNDYFALFLSLKRLEMDLYDVMGEHRELIVSNELWETYMNNGSRMLNAGTSNDGTFYFAYLPANRIELFMLLESDRMANPVFREYYTERDVVMEELRMGLNDPEGVLYDSFMATAYTASQYGVPVVGWASDVSMITRADLQDYFDRNYAPNNAVGFFAGDVDPEWAKKLAERYFGAIPRGEDLPALTTREPEQQGERRVVVRQDAKPSLMIGYHVPANPHPDSYALNALQSILSSGRTSRFYKGIYEEQGLTREAPQAWMGPGDRLDPLFMVTADPKEPHTLGEVEAAILRELERVKVEPVSTRELERVWNQDEASLVRALGSNAGLAFRVGFYAALRGDWRALLVDMERLKQVTPEDIMRVASKYLTEENRTVGWLVETESAGDREEEIDIRELMMWAQTLPEEEQRELMTQFQTLDEGGREALAKKLWERMKADQS